jgi:hypothetical protein
MQVISVYDNVTDEKSTLMVLKAWKTSLWEQDLD